MLEGRAWVIGVGARGPLGLSHLQVAMNVRAGLLQPRPSHFKDRRGRSIGTCRVGGLPMDLAGYDRLLALAAPSLREAWPKGSTPPLPVVIALPEPGRPDDDPRFGPTFLSALGARSRCPIDLPRSSVVRAGHAGFAMALMAASAMLRQNSGSAAPPAVLVGGVDSYHQEEVLRRLESEHRLHAFGTEDGMIPGEGAAFAALTLAGTRALGSTMAAGRPFASLAGVRVGQEDALQMGRPSLADALTSIVQELAGAEAGFPWVLTDLNGERHRNREWAMLEVRGALAEGGIHHSPAQHLGDVGAASGALLLSIACTFFATGAAPAAKAAVVLQSDGPERGAFVLEEVA